MVAALVGSSLRRRSSSSLRARARYFLYLGSILGTSRYSKARKDDPNPRPQLNRHNVVIKLYSRHEQSKCGRWSLHCSPFWGDRLLFAVPRQDVPMSIDHNEFERELRRSSSGFMSPTAFLRRRASQGQQRRPLGKLLDNVIARSSSAIELIKSPLKGRGALRLSNAIEMIKSPMKGQQSKKDAPVRLLPAVSAASQPRLITPSWSDEGFTNLAVQSKAILEVKSLFDEVEQPPADEKKQEQKGTQTRRSGSGVLPTKSLRTAAQGPDALQDIPMHLQYDVKQLFGAFAATRPNAIREGRVDPRSSNIIQHFPGLGQPTSWESPEEIRKAFALVLKLYFRPTAPQLAAMLAVVGPQIADLMRGKWAASIKSQHGSSILTCFRSADLDASGEIDVEEFLYAVAETKLDEAHARALFAAADTDGSGTLDMDEFIKLVCGSPTLVDAFADILKAAAERRQRLEQQRLSVFFKEPPVSPTSGMRRRPSLAIMRRPEDVKLNKLPWGTFLMPTAGGVGVGRV